MPAALRSSPGPDEDVVYVRYPRPDNAGDVGFDELAVVALTVAIEADAVTLPAGTLGTIVAIWKAGEAYEIEFPEPVGTLVTVTPDEIRTIQP